MSERKQHILVADDDNAVRTFVTRALRQYDYDVTAATGGQEALRLLDELHPDLILLDIMMPEINGIEVLKVVSARYANLPVIMLTGLNDTKLLEQAFELGAVDYITKPVLASILVARIRAKLRRIPG